MMLDNQYHIAYAYSKKLIERNSTIGKDLLAFKRSCSHRKVIAIIYDSSGQQIAVGYNQYKSHPLQKQYADHPDKIYLHAEIDAIANSIRSYRGINGLKLLNDSTMFIFRFNKDMTLGLAKPCLGCQRAIRAFDIKTVIWSGV